MIKVLCYHVYMDAAWDAAKLENDMMKPALAFELNNAKWHIQVARGADGLAVITRLRGGPRKTWKSPDRTPEGWVAIQRHAAQYKAVPAPAFQLRDYQLAAIEQIKKLGRTVTLELPR